MVRFELCQRFLPDRELELYAKVLKSSFEPINPADMVEIQQAPDDFFINPQVLRQFYLTHILFRHHHGQRQLGRCQNIERHSGASTNR